MVELKSKLILLNAIRRVIEEKKGLAVGKLGFSEQFMLGYLPFLESNPTELQIRSYESLLRYYCENQFGVFPTSVEYLNKFASFYGERVRTIDFLGLFGVDQEERLVLGYGKDSMFVKYQDTEPDRSIPDNPSNCYLPFFADKRILFISPFADLLKERAQKETFELTWANTQKKWFYPRSISAIKIPYSYGSSVSTHIRYGNSTNLFESICSKIDKHEFDIAIMGVGALGLPLASYIKYKGKLAISMGGHMQVLFGVLGARWKNDEYWKSKYINDTWIDMPEKYYPVNRDQLSDKGAYW